MRMLSFPPAELERAHVSSLDAAYKKEEEEENKFELDRTSAKKKKNVSIFFLLPY
jgi:hypothetical protein